MGGHLARLATRISLDRNPKRLIIIGRRRAEQPKRSREHDRRVDHALIGGGAPWKAPCILSSGFRVSPPYRWERRYCEAKLEAREERRDEMRPFLERRVDLRESTR